MIEEGTRVSWAGNQNRWCAPGYNGTVLKVAHHDENSLKVLWDEREFGTLYTWERRANLKRKDDEAPALVLVA